MTTEAMALQIFTAETTVQNLHIRSIVVPPSTIEEILGTVTLPSAYQEKVVQEMVDANPEAYASLTQEEAQQQIYLRLTQKTVVEYLKTQDVFGEAIDYSCGFNHEGAIVIDAFSYDNNEIQDSLELEVKKKEAKKALIKQGGVK